VIAPEANAGSVLLVGKMTPFSPNVGKEMLVREAVAGLLSAVTDPLPISLFLC